MNKKTIPIVFCANNFYIKYLIVTLQSIILHADPEYIYEIFILHTEDTILEQKTLLNMHTSNIKITFYNISDKLQNIELLSTRAYITKESYYRFFIPELFCNKYNKVLYLDCDLICETDIKNLYNIDLKSYPLGAIKNPQNKTFSEYRTFYLNLDEKTYFNAGVLLINTKRCMEFELKRKMFDTLKKYPNLLCMDQDILNILFKGNNLLIDFSWNYQYSVALSPQNYKDSLEIEKYMKDKKPNIIHYTTSKKPWNYLNKYSERWWYYCKKSPIYKELKPIYKKMKTKNILQNIFSIKKNIKNNYTYKLFKILGITFKIKVSAKINSYLPILANKAQGIEFCKNKINTLIIGSSYLEKGYIADKNEYNLASSAQDLYYTYNLYKLYNNKNIKNIITSFSVFTPCVSLIKTSNGSMSILFKELFGIDYQDTETAIKREYHLLEKEYKKAIKKHYTKSKNDENYRGNKSDYPTPFKNVIDAEIIATKHYKYNNGKISQLGYLEKLIKETAKNNQNIIFVITPTTDEYRKMLPDKSELFKDLYNITKEYQHIKIFDFYDSTIFSKEDFFDYDHLNQKGAEKLTEIIKSVI